MWRAGIIASQWRRSSDNDIVNDVIISVKKKMNDQKTKWEEATNGEEEGRMTLWYRNS